jgi:hypothetical protein
MKMKICFIGIVVVMIGFTACKGKNKTDDKNGSDVDTVKFYPVNQYIQAEIDSLIKLDKAFTKVTTINKQTADSATITAADFKAFANFFLEKDITKQPVKKEYKENIFRSLTTGTVVFNYTSTNPASSIRTIDVSLNDADSKIKRVDIKNLYSKGDSSYTENLSWVFGSKCYINRFAQGKDQKSTITTTTIRW